jgi:glycosyltransferase involved in cell wall biosynthesis
MNAFGVVMHTRKARICFVTREYPPHAGGAARSARRLVQGLASAGFTVSVVSAIASPRQRATRADGPVAVRWVLFNLEDATRAIEEADAAAPFDVFHGFTLVAAYPCLEIAARGRRPVVSSIRGVDGLTFDEFTTEVLRRSDWVTSVSGDSLVRAGAHTDLAQRSCVIPNGIETDGIPQWSPSTANRGVVGTVSTFRNKKNIPLLIRAYARLPQDLRRGLLLVGAVRGDDEESEAALQQRIDDAIDEADLRRDIVITGMVEHSRVPEYHQRMRVFALSSDHEGMPNSILEAAASGLPIVATAVDGIKDIFTDGVDALLVPPNDAQALASALQRVLMDEALAQRLSAAARRLAERLSVAEEVRRYVELYETLLAGRPASLT